MIQRKKCFLVLLIGLFCQFHTYAQSQYFITDKEGFDFVLNIDVDGTTLNGFTRENALLDYASKLEYRVIKLASSLKHPEIIRFNAILANGHFEGTYDYLFSSYKVVGKMDKDSISYSLFDNDNVLRRSFEGKRITSYTKKDYHKLAQDIINITEADIYDPTITQSKKWSQFKDKFLSVSSKTYDDLEFQVGFFALIRKIGFSHYYISKNIIETNAENDKSTLTEIDKSTALLRIKSFAERQNSIKPLLDSIQSKGYSNLIIDIRDNPGGNFESTFLVANFLTDKEFISGFFPNRTWYETYHRLPNKNDIDKFSLMDNDSIQTDPKYGFYAKTKGSEHCFKGKVYLLVNHNTGSAAEALAIGAKEYGLATLVGEKTAGGLLKIKKYKMDDDILLFIPAYDFISYNGYRVDQNGVKPDIETKKGQELEALKHIIQQ